jgi:hypothetical protein
MRQNMIRKATKEEVEAAKIKKKNAIAEFIRENPKGLGNVLKNVPDSFKNIMLNAFLGKNTNSKSLKAKCLECSGFDREEIRNCTVWTCPLHKVRPYK